MSESFKPMPGNEQLFVPAHVANEAELAKYQQDPNYQEMQGQNEVLGEMGLGSIRADSEHASDGGFRVTDRRKNAHLATHNFDNNESAYLNAYDAAGWAADSDAREEQVANFNKHLEGDELPADVKGNEAAGGKKTYVQTETANGTKRVYEVDPDGKKRPVKFDDVLEGQGIDPKEHRKGLGKHKRDTKLEGDNGDAKQPKAESETPKTAKEHIEDLKKKLDQVAKDTESDNAAEEPGKGFDIVTPGKALEVHPGGKDKKVPGKELEPVAKDDKENLPAVPSSKELDKYPDRRLPKELAMELAYAMKDYGELAAKRERLTVTPKLTEKKLEEARLLLEAARGKANKFAFEKLNELGFGPKEIMALSRFDAKTDARLINLDIKINAERFAAPKGMFKESRAKFLNWWARQGAGESAFSKAGMKAMLKKGGVMALIGAPVGVAAGVAGATLLGPVAGAALAAGAARGVARGLMRGRIDQAASAMSLADKRFQERTVAQHELIDGAYDIVDEAIDTEDAGLLRDGAVIVNEVGATVASKESVEANVARNRRRAMASVAIGAVAGGVAAEAAHYFFGGNGPSSKPETHTPQQRPTGPRHTPNRPERGSVVNVEAGSGEIREIQEYANAHGLDIDGQRATEIFNKLHAEHGNNIIDLRGPGANTYNIGGNPNNPGLLHPDARAHWFPGIEEEIMKEAAKSGDKLPNTGA